MSVQPSCLRSGDSPNLPYEFPKQKEAKKNPAKTQKPCLECITRARAWTYRRKMLS
jgi:hypothetical protein